MAVTANVFNVALSDFAKGRSGWIASSTSLKMALYTTLPALSATTYSTTGEVANGGGYTQGGTALTSVTDPVVTAAASWGTARANTTAYVVGDIVRPASGATGFLYVCAVAGTSAGSPPTFPTAPVQGQTVTDGTVTWSCIGESITTFGSASPSWAGSTISALGAIIYHTTNSCPLLRIDFGQTFASASSTYQITVPVLTGVPSGSQNAWFWLTPA